MELTLTAEATAAIGALAAEVCAGRPRFVDDLEWLALARTASCRLPLEVREALRAFRYDPGPDAVLVLHGLPVPERHLPPTPTVPLSVQAEATPFASALAIVALQVGELIAFRPEKKGALVQNVVPVPGRETDQSNVGSIELKMHVENAFHPYRPDLVALFCLRGDPDGRAELTVASVRRALSLLSSQTRHVLGKPWFVTDPPPSFTGGSAPGTEHAILLGDGEDPDVRVDFCSTRPCNVAAGAAMAALEAALDVVTRRIKLAPGDLAMVDNRLAVHGRTAFVPRYDGADRWLQRSFVQLNYRLSRASRPGGGAVLD